ncbi:uncharacterized protein LOC143023520 [Oratosquilla oratoria]|uniref:uncharacterized protein LOC143023520 n=1 Tax=Oratosquilla oratoria TaxID=337810 RepID=UPI003F75ED67
MPKLPAPEIICTLEESSGNSEGLRLVGGASPQNNIPQCSSGGSGSVGDGSGGDCGSGDSESEPLRPKSQRRYSQDDIKCHYRSLDVVLGVPNDAGDAPRRLSQQLEKDALLLDPLSVRRQSVASVQTEEVRMSPRQYDRRRRSRCEYDFVSAENRRRRSREEAAGRTSRRGSSTNELLLRVDQDRRASRESTSSNGYHRRGSTVPQYLSVRDHRDIEARRVSSTSVISRVSSRPTMKPLDPAERRRHKVVMVCASVAVGILLIAILLIAVTLRLSPTIDEMGKLRLCMFSN